MKQMHYWRGSGEDWTGDMGHIQDEKYEIITQDHMEYWNPPPTPDLQVIVICHSKRQCDEECLEDNYGHPEQKRKRR